MGLGQLGGQAVEVEDEVVRIGMYQWMNWDGAKGES